MEKNKIIPTLPVVLLSKENLSIKQILFHLETFN